MSLKEFLDEVKGRVVGFSSGYGYIIAIVASAWVVAEAIKQARVGGPYR